MAFLLFSSLSNNCPDYEPVWVNILELFSNLMLTINSSVNFFIYYLSNKVNSKWYNQAIMPSIAQYNII